MRLLGVGEASLREGLIGRPDLISFLTVGPFALPFVWPHPVYRRRKKVIVTVIVPAETCALIAVFFHALKVLFDYDKQPGIF